MKTLLFSILLFLSQWVYATDAQLTFKVVDEANNKLKKVAMKIYQGNTLIESDTLRSSKAKLSLEVGKYYTIEVSLDHHHSKKIIVDLRGEARPDLELDYTFYVELEHTDKYVDVESSEDFLDYPIAMVEMDEESYELTYNKTYMYSSIRHKKVTLYPANEEAEEATPSLVLND